MRHETAGSVLALARRLAATAEGLTTGEIAQDLGVCRRTAERMRDVVEELFPALEVITDGPTKRFPISKDLDGFMRAPTTPEVVEFSRAVYALLHSGQPDRATTLQSLSHEIQGAMRAD